LTVPERPVISIVIPSLQEEKYLARTLAQFPPELKQRHGCEVIVSDGGSADRTVAIARQMADTVLEHAGNVRQTISAGRNLGARSARGEILVFLNADTVVETPDLFLDTIVRLLRDRRLAALTCNVSIYPEEEIFSDRLFHAFFNYYFWLLNVIGLGMGRGECQVMRRELFERVGGYNESLAAGEDFDLFVRLRRIGRIKSMRTMRVLESPRRFRKFGYGRILWLWFQNGISVLVRGRSLSTHWEPVR
jgi:glycosyltransferase involved in cell wall biosynthesis